MEKNYPQQKGVIGNMAGTEVSVMKELKGILATDNVKNRFNEVLGKKAPQFMTSIINVQCEFYHEFSIGSGEL